jgi:hypothetical protein
MKEQRKKEQQDIIDKDIEKRYLRYLVRAAHSPARAYEAHTTHHTTQHSRFGFGFGIQQKTKKKQGKGKK